MLTLCLHTLKHYEPCSNNCCSGQMKPVFNTSVCRSDIFTSVEQIGRQTVDWDAVISPLEVLGIQTCIVSTEDEEIPQCYIFLDLAYEHTLVFTVEVKNELQPNSRLSDGRLRCSLLSSCDISSRHRRHGRFDCLRIKLCLVQHRNM